MENYLEEKPISKPIFPILFLILLAVGIVFFYLNFREYIDRIITRPSSPSSPKILSTQKGPLILPGDNPSPEELRRFHARIREIAVETGTIVINKCKANPAVFRTKSSEPVVFENRDTAEHTIAFNFTSVKVPAGEIASVSPGLLPDGVNGFGCDATGETIGFIVVEPMGTDE